MKKILSLLMMFVVILGLAACNKEPNKPGTTTKKPGTSTPIGDTTPQTGDHPTFNGEKLIILHGNLAEVDPYHEKYSGKFQSEKQALIEQVEAKYDVDIVFQLYPENAAWGGDRKRAIVNGVTSQEPMGHIYAISTNWIPDLADQHGIVPITEWDEEFGSEHFTDSLKTYVQYKQDLWGFDTGKRYNDVGIFYNVGMIEDAGLEDPATLWMEGKWTWNKFREQVLALSRSFTAEDLYALSGDPAIWTQYMIGSNGSTILDPDTYQIQLTDAPTIQALEFMNGLYTIKQGWDPLYGGDSSPAFLGGKVAFHQGELWFVTEENRFGGRNFGEIGYVPFPVGPAIDEDLSNYHIASTSAAVWAISGGYDEASVAEGGLTDYWIYKIWTEMTYWTPEDELDSDLQMTILTKFSHVPSQLAYMDVKDKNYYEQYLNFMNFYDSGLNSGFKRAVANGSARAEMTALKEKLQLIVNEKLNK